MTAYVRSGLQLLKRRRVLAGSEERLRAALARGAVRPQEVERVRAGQLGYLKALRHELTTGTDLDDERQARLAAAHDAERYWRGAAAAEILAAYAAGQEITPGQVLAPSSTRSS